MKRRSSMNVFDVDRETVIVLQSNETELVPMNISRCWQRDYFWRPIQWKENDHNQFHLMIRKRKSWKINSTTENWSQWTLLDVDKARFHVDAHTSSSNSLIMFLLWATDHYEESCTKHRLAWQSVSIITNEKEERREAWSSRYIIEQKIEQSYERDAIDRSSPIAYLIIDWQRWNRSCGRSMMMVNQEKIRSLVDWKGKQIIFTIDKDGRWSHNCSPSIEKLARAVLTINGDGRRRKSCFHFRLKKVKPIGLTIDINGRSRGNSFDNRLKSETHNLQGRCRCSLNRDFVHCRLRYWSRSPCRTISTVKEKRICLILHWKSEVDCLDDRWRWSMRRENTLNRDLHWWRYLSERESVECGWRKLKPFALVDWRRGSLKREFVRSRWRMFVDEARDLNELTSSSMSMFDEYRTHSFPDERLKWIVYRSMRIFLEDKGRNEFTWA